jgi:hypothetical protein
MKHIVRKFYWDFEKEENWLNEMSAKGMALTDYSRRGRYVFIEAPKNEYIYRIELLQHLPTHAESRAYIRFLEESGIECVATYSRWIFLRKKSSDGPFDIYSDIESKISHYKRIYLFWNTLMWVELICGLTNLIVGVVNININNKLGNLPVGNFFAGCLLTSVGIFFLKLGLPIRRKIKTLQQEKIISE